MTRFPSFDPGAVTLEVVSHYHQSPGVHPKPILIPAYYERVELVTDGHGAIMDGPEWREVEPGDLIWNKPGDFTIGRSRFTDPYRCLAVTLVTRKARGLGLPRFSRWPNREEVKSFALEATRCFRDESFDRGVLRDYILARLLFRMHLDDRGEEPALPEPLRIAQEWIRKNYATPCRIETVAGAVGWSSAHLHHAFRAHLRITPHQAVIRERLRAAREKLVSTSHPVKRIAVECGFTDAPAFTHVFKLAEGLTPGAYRKRYLSLAGTALR